jgi:hypothetical protein
MRVCHLFQILLKVWICTQQERREFPLSILNETFNIYLLWENDANVEGYYLRDWSTTPRGQWSLCLMLLQIDEIRNWSCSSKHSISKKLSQQSFKLEAWLSLDKDLIIERRTDFLPRHKHAIINTSIKKIRQYELWPHQVRFIYLEWYHHS